MAGHAEVHSLRPSNVLSRLPYFAPVGPHHSLLCLRQEGFDHLCQVETKTCISWFMFRIILFITWLIELLYNEKTAFDWFLRGQFKIKSV